MIDDKHDDMARLRIITISYENFVALLRGRGHVPNLPKDAIIVGHAEDFASLGFRLKIWSSEFSPVADGKLIPPYDMMSVDYSGFP